MSEHEGYLLDNRHEEAGRRFDALAELFNPVTFRHFEAVGVKAGWRVWEVGAGGPEVAQWLVDRVGPLGHVVATDIDARYLGVSTETLTVLTHDVAADPVPDESFDLIHARLLLVHVVERDRVIRTMIDALRPGGWLLLEEADPSLQELVCLDECGEAQILANRLKRGFRTLMRSRGVDLAFGRTLPRRLREGGLASVSADAYFPVGGPLCNELERATTEQIRHLLVDAGIASDEEIDRHLANVASGALDLTTSPMISAWGRTPNARTP